MLTTQHKYGTHHSPFYYFERLVQVHVVAEITFGTGEHCKPGSRLSPILSSICQHSCFAQHRVVALSCPRDTLDPLHVLYNIIPSAELTVTLARGPTQLRK